MIPIEELKLLPPWAWTATDGLLMIPIEELKQCQNNRFRCQKSLLMIPIEELKRCHYAEGKEKSVWTFDDTYWGIETHFRRWRRSSFRHLLMIPIEELKLNRQTASFGSINLLMIPIEELKHSVIEFGSPVVVTFDDTYWAIHYKNLRFCLDDWAIQVCNIYKFFAWN